jgi:AcrR family transcriptional regulator
MAAQRNTATAEQETGAEGTRERLVAAAFGLFLENGYHGTSMRQIAQRAGIALGGIYNHFSSKEDLFVAVLSAHHPYIEIMPKMAAAQGDTVENLVRDAAGRMLKTLKERPDTLHLMFIEIVEFEGRHTVQLSTEIFPQLMDFAQRFIQAHGPLRPIPLPILIRAFVGLFFSYFMSEWIIGQEFPQELQPNAFEHFVDIYLHGILGSAERG